MPSVRSVSARERRSVRRSSSASFSRAKASRDDNSAYTCLKAGLGSCVKLGRYEGKSAGRATRERNHSMSMADASLDPLREVHPPGAVRHDWARAEIRDLFLSAFPDLVFLAQQVHRLFFDPR